jgi:carboxymethylenebutenolidase
MISWQTETGSANGYLALPASGHGPGVLVLHAWWGLTEFIEALCDRFAAAGFVALAPDLYGNGATAETIAEAEQLIQADDYEGIQAIVGSAVHFLAGHSAVQGNGIGVVGFSFGAPYAILAACELAPTEIDAVVLFYGNYPGLGSDVFGKAQAAFLGHFAENDPYEDAEELDKTLAEMHKAGRKAWFHEYPGTGHWFFENDRPDAYDAEAAELAWERTVAFLQAKSIIP